MAWREVDTVRRSFKVPAAARVRVTGGGGLHVSLSAETVAKLDWRESTTLTLLVGSAESEGRIALKPKPRGPIAVVFNKGRGAGKPSGRVYVGHFDQLVRADRKSEEPLVEHKNDQLILTMPEGWLKGT